MEVSGESNRFVAAVGPFSSRVQSHVSQMKFYLSGGIMENLYFQDSGFVCCYLFSFLSL